MTEDERTLARAEHVMGVFGRAAIHRINGGLPPFLYHYTSAASLVSIFKSGCFWVNDLNHLNDVSELRYSASVLRAHIDRMRAVEDHDEVRPLFDVLQSAIGSMKFDGVYILSLVPEGDDQHLWNLYSDRGRGVSIAVPTFDPMTNWEGGWFLLKCQYGDEAVNEFCRHAVGTIRAIYAIDVFENKAAPVEAYARLFLDNVRWFAPAFKIGTWADEREWRLFRIGASEHGQRLQRPDGRHYVKAPCQIRLNMPAASYGPNCSLESVLSIRKAAAENGYGNIALLHSNHALPSHREAIDRALGAELQRNRS